MIKYLQQYIDDPWILRLIRKFLTSGILDHGLFAKSEKGTPQGGPLSPLLANIYLNELDKELTRRGYHFVRYADDCNIYVKSQRAGERVMRSITQFLEKRLKVKVNPDKTKVGSPLRLKFLGFSLGVDHNGAYARPAKQSQQRVKKAVTMEIRDEEENKIKTNLDYSQEYMKFANSYYKTGIYLVKDILHNRNSPRILDTIFPIALFLMRQGIELLCKALILEKIPTEDALLLFKKNQHDLYNLWRAYQNLNLNIREETSKKLSEYFENINVFDKNSDLWRYPLFEEDNNTQEKIAMLEGRTISIERTFESLNNAFNMLLNLNEKPQSLEHYINFINENEDALINTHL